MNAPAPVSALNILARPEKHVSPQGSSNDSSASFSSALEQQKKAVTQSEKPANAARQNESKSTARNDAAIDEGHSQANKRANQDTDRLAQNEAAQENSVSDTTTDDTKAERRQRETEEKQLVESAQIKISPDAVIQGPAAAGEKVLIQAVASGLKQGPQAKPVATEQVAKKLASADDINVRQLETSSGKTGQAPFSAAQEIVSATNNVTAHGASRQETGLPTKTQAPGLVAGAAIVKNNERLVGARTEGLHNRTGTHRLDTINLERVEAGFTRTDNTSAFLDRVVEARRLSGQQLLQNTLHSETAAATAERPTGGSEAVSGIIMGSPFNNAFSLGSATVSTPIGHGEWGRDFSRQVSSFGQHLKNGLQTIELRLDPPDLGPIRISLSMSDNVAQASFISPHATVRHAVEQALPQLQEQLAQAGISLGQTSVGEQQQQGSQNTAMSNTKTSVSSTDGVRDTNDTPQLQTSTQRSHNGQVDTFA